MQKESGKNLRKSLLNSFGDLMEQAILNNIYHLYRSYIVTAILYLILAILIFIVGICVCKFKLMGSIRDRVIIMVIAFICSVGLIFIHILNTIPVYKDYKEQSYIVLENATITIKSGAIGNLDQFNRVIVKSDGREMNLKIPSDPKLSTGIEYTGTIAYLEHSGYLIWYCFDK